MSLAGIACLAVGGLALAWCLYWPTPGRAMPSSNAADRAEPMPEAAASPVVRLLGPVMFEGTAEPVRGAKVGELIAYLATHPRGATDGEIKAALWMDRPVAGGTFNNTVSLARRALGRDPEDQLHLPSMSDGRYRLNRVTTDVERILGEPIEAERARLLARIAGPPFAGVSWEWPLSRGLVDHAAVAIAGVALETAESLRRSGQHRLASEALRGALRCAPGDGQLYAALIECRFAEGDRAGAARLRRERDAVGL